MGLVAIDFVILRPWQLQAEVSDHRSVCPWKGTARYFTINANGAVNPDAAWTYPDPKPEAERIRAHVAFWKGVEVA